VGNGAIAYATGRDRIVQHPPAASVALARWCYDQTFEGTAESRFTERLEHNRCALHPIAAASQCDPERTWS
jgi:hypothetical protein